MMKTTNTADTNAQHTRASASRRCPTFFVRGAALAALAAAGCVVSLTGCAAPPRDALTAPKTLGAPYDTSRGEVLWAVLPLRNESGAGEVDTDLITDKLIGAVEEAQGLRCVPLARTLNAMASLRYTSIRSAGDARSLAQAMGVDGVLVGSITSYDPYTPNLGLSLALYARPNAMANPQTGLDPHALSRSASDSTIPTYNPDKPLATFSDRWDAKNNSVLLDVKAFAEGRMKQPSAFGWRRYLASMDLYSEFAAYRAVDALLQQEWVRTGKAAVVSAQQAMER